MKKRLERVLKQTRLALSGISTKILMDLHDTVREIYKRSYYDSDTINDKPLKPQRTNSTFASANPQPIASACKRAIFGKPSLLKL